MSITIHHGGNGSYKSSGVIQDYIVPAAKAGRVVCTNLRGMSRQRTIEVMGEGNVHDDFDVLTVDTGTREGREKVLRFWHWVPHGALLVWDESNMCFPKALKQSDLDKLDYKTLEEAEADDRPHAWLQAWEMHRHYNWDIILMCPSIKSVRSDIRDTSEGAYKHVNMALIGIKGRYKEGFHEAENNGSASNITISKIKRVTKQTFALYDSSKTGTVRDTINGVPLWKSPRLMGALALAALAIGYSVTSGGLGYFFGSSPASDSVGAVGSDLAAVADVVAVPAAVTAAGTIVRPNSMAAGPVSQDAVSHPLRGKSFEIVGSVRLGEDRDYSILATAADGSSIRTTASALARIGYAVIGVDRCLMRLRYGEFSETVFCSYQLPPPVGSELAAASGVPGASKAGTLLTWP